MTRERLMDAYLGDAKKRDREAVWQRCQDYPLQTWSDGGKVCQRKLTPDGRQTAVQTAVITDEDRLPLLCECLLEGGCVGVICNTVARDQRFAMEARQAMPDTEVMVCHAQFVMPQRLEIEDRLKHLLGRDGVRPRKLLLVGTQVIEQSLDIDMDMLITDLCPMDMLLQRVGRLHRHERPRPERLRAARCFVTGASDEAIADDPIYEPYLLWRTRDLIPEQLILPNDIASLVQSVYGDDLPSNASDALIEARERMVRNIHNRETRARAYRLQEPTRASRYRPATLHGLLDRGTDVDDAAAEASVRDGGATVEVLLLRRAGEKRTGLAWDDQAQRTVALDRTPCTENAIAISRQRLRLPWSLCTPWRVDATIREMEAQTALAVPEWAQSYWLKGELVLLLDEDGVARLNRFLLRYDACYGLICEREGR